MSTTPLEQVTQLYQAYTEQVASLEANRKFGQGILGFGGRVSDHPCHDQFFRALHEMTAAFVQAGISPQDARAVVEKILREPRRETEGPSTFWMMIAAQGAARALIPSLEKEDAKALLDWYLQAYRKRERLPVQLQVIKDLEKALS